MTLKERIDRLNETAKIDIENAQIFLNSLNWEYRTNFEFVNGKIEFDGDLTWERK